MSEPDNMWNQFDPVSRTWWVSPAFFAYVQEQCRLDQKWIERQHAGGGPGEILIKVLHAHERRSQSRE